MRCSSCLGSGKICGLGMVSMTCHYCDGDGKVLDELEELEYLKRKNPDAFQEAKEKIMAADESLTSDDAEHYLSKEVKQKKNRWK